MEGYVKTPVIAEYNESVYSQYTIETENRNHLQEELNKKGIPTAIYYPNPLHRQTLFKKYLTPPKTLTVTDIKGQRVLSLPVHPYLKKEEQDFIIEGIQKSL